MFVPRSDTLSAKRPLKYHTGAEVAETVVVDYTTVTADSLGRRLIDPGELFTEITASGKYGPYLKSATDGRQGITHKKAVIVNQAANVELGDKAIGGWYHNCVFDVSELDLKTVPIHSSALQNAFPTCIWDD